MFDESVCFVMDKNMFSDVGDMIKCINQNCDSIYFDRIPLMSHYNHDIENWEIYTTKEYVKALEYCLKDMYWG